MYTTGPPENKNTAISYRSLHPPKKRRHSDMTRIEDRFLARRRILNQFCLENNLDPILGYSNISNKNTFYNHIFHDESLGPELLKRKEKVKIYYFMEK